MYEYIRDELKRRGKWDFLDEMNKKAWDSLEEKDIATYKRLYCEMEKMYYAIDCDEAEAIVMTMKPYGQVWSMDTVKNFINEQGIYEDTIEWYLVMNMMKNDYCETARIYGLQDDAMFYFCLAKNFIHDIDAKPYKVEKYFKM